MSAEMILAVIFWLAAILLAWALGYSAGWNGRIRIVEKNEQDKRDMRARVHQWGPGYQPGRAKHPPRQYIDSDMRAEQRVIDKLHAMHTHDARINPAPTYAKPPAPPPPPPTRYVRDDRAPYIPQPRDGR